VEVGAGLAELIAEGAGLGAGELEGLLVVSTTALIGDLAASGQKAAAKARPRAPATRSFSSSPTGLMATVWTASLELTVPRQRAPG